MAPKKGVTEDLEIAAKKLFKKARDKGLEVKYPRIVRGSWIKPPNHKLTPMYAIHLLRKMLVRRVVYGLPGTNGSFLTNYIEVVKNEHIVFGLFYANPVHPFTRRERCIFAFNTIAFIFWLGVLTSREPAIVYYLLIAAATMLYEKLSRLLLECGPMYTRGYDPQADQVPTDIVDRASSAAKKVAGATVEFTGSLLSACLFCAAFIFIISGVVIAVKRGDAFLIGSFLLNQVFAIFILDFVVLAFQFWVKFSLFNHGIKFRFKFSPHFGSRKYTLCPRHLSC